MTTHTSNSPLPVNPPPTDLHTKQAVEKIYYPSSTVRQEPPFSLFPHSLFPSFCKSQLTSATHSLVICLSIVSKPQFSSNKIYLGSPGNRTGRHIRHIHHTTTYCHLQNSRLFQLAWSRTDLRHIFLSSHLHNTSLSALPHPNIQLYLSNRQALNTCYLLLLF